MSSYSIQVKKPGLDFERRGECDDPARLDEMLIGAIDELRQFFPAKPVRSAKSTPGPPRPSVPAVTKSGTPSSSEEAR